MIETKNPDEELGRIAYEAAAAVTGCNQPWEEANKEKWIAAGKAAAQSVQEKLDAREVKYSEVCLKWHDAVDKVRDLEKKLEERDLQTHHR